MIVYALKAIPHEQKKYIGIGLNGMCFSLTSVTPRKWESGSTPDSDRRKDPGRSVYKCIAMMT
ncbi:MAG TPA: hypothetical protein VMW09_00485, partial [Desulfatiglandales bacterium]|nr:hypothetical protein [Desulfatiglandales bacterium]